MKVRKQAKSRFAYRLSYLVWAARWDKKMQAIADRITKDLVMAPEAVQRREESFNALWDDIVSKQGQRQLVEPDPEVEAAKQEFVVVKKSTGEVVGTFDLREDAEAMVEKAKKQKRAALMLLDTVA